MLILYTIQSQLFTQFILLRLRDTNFKPLCQSLLYYSYFFCLNSVILYLHCALVRGEGRQKNRGRLQGKKQHGRRGWARLVYILPYIFFYIAVIVNMAVPKFKSHFITAAHPVFQPTKNIKLTKTGCFVACVWRGWLKGRGEGNSHFFSITWRGWLTRVLL